MQLDSVRDRFIPTFVGNTLSQELATLTAAVHPHVCGEHLFFWQKNLQNYGSSPRLWGTLYQSFSCIESVRFIPTFVGNTVEWCEEFEKTPVHPHVCGEHSKIYRLFRLSGGSSPRLWGTRLDYSMLERKVRFIPTFVGNTTVKSVPSPL